MIAEREKQIHEFKPKSFYGMQAIRKRRHSHGPIKRGKHVRLIKRRLSNDLGNWIVSMKGM